MPRKKTTDPEASQRTRKAQAVRSKKGSMQTETGKLFPIVGLGASAGGLEALKAFFSKVPEDTGMAFVVVVHMTPKQPSMMPELLQKTASIPVSAAKDGQMVAPNNAYIISPDKDIAVFKGKLQLLEQIKKGISHPIDIFLRSLALDQGEQSAAVILSGTGTDGTLGLKEIKARDGLVLVQSEESATYDGMPRSAINTGLADMVLAPQDMPKKLVEYFRYTKANFGKATATTVSTQDWLSKIFGILRAHTGHDFSAYKINTIMRRIGRRMGLNHIEDYRKYTRYLRENTGEIDALFRELLIGVTSFFRDKDSYDVLKSSVLPAYFKSLEDGATFRIWIPGCSTGEEVYSLAIVLREVLDKHPKHVELQVFGTDIDSHAIERARDGVYPASIAADVDEGRLKRFFTKEGDFFRIRKEIRDCVVFSMQDILQDPPFSRLDMLCCRNLLIYLDSEAQKKLLPLFHYTLKPEGILVLGSSETIGGFSRLFATLDKKWKIFKRQVVPKSLHYVVNFPSGPAIAAAPREELRELSPLRTADIALITQKALLDQFAPTAVLVDGRGEILNVQGRTGKYLEQIGGPPTNNILDLAREGLRIELSSALRAAKSASGRVTRKRLMVKTNGDTQMIDLHVCPQKKPAELVGRYLVVFEDIDPDSVSGSPGSNGNQPPPSDPSRIAELENELQITRESHQTTIEELESTNEELKSINEEMQSSNEELQSTNEELESSKEELQSLNEELQTVNSELQSKVEELSAAHDDMRNLLNSTEIGTIFVDNDLRIRRYTQKATEIVNLIQTDIGRPLSHVVSNLKYDMIADILEVTKKLSPKKIQVEKEGGQWFEMNIIPYRTTDNRIDGAVITFVNVTDRKNAHELLQEQMNELVRSVFDMNTDPLVVLDADGEMVIANTAFSRLLGIGQNDVKGMKIQGIQEKTKRKIGLDGKLQAALKTGIPFETVAFNMDTAEGLRKFSIKGNTMKFKLNLPYRILLRLVAL